MHNLNKFRGVLRLSTFKIQLFTVGVSILIFLMILKVLYDSYFHKYEINTVNTDLFLQSTDSSNWHQDSESEDANRTLEKIIHLDLKGAPPLVSYYETFFPFIRRLGATGLLIEYEDMFPYSEELSDIRAENAYSPAQISKILSLAEQNNLFVIPLIQTFGHFEFVLKQKKYKSYREVEKYPQVICPNHVNTSTLIQTMIDQIIKAHPKSKYVHIGCDEVYYIGKCQKCISRKAENNWSTNDLFLDHIKKTTEYIRAKHSGVRPIIWSDMIAKIDEKLILQYKVPQLTDIMAWDYRLDIKFGTINVFGTYAKLFESIWVAGAFKGATGVNKIVTDTRHHLTNLLAWTDVIKMWRDKLYFKGIVLTGWQRYDHFSVLCELLPVAIPSLAATLEYVRNFDKGMKLKRLMNLLECSDSVPLSPWEVGKIEIKNCNFPGFRIYELVNHFYLLRDNIKEPFPNSSNGWLSSYNIFNRFSSPAQVEHFFENYRISLLELKLRNIRDKLREALSQVYDKYTVNEWILTHITPLQMRFEVLTAAKDYILNEDNWSRRPLFGDNKYFHNSVSSFCKNQNKLCGAILIV